MIEDTDDEEVIWWMHEIAYIVRVMQSSWKEITVQSVARELHDMYDPPGTTPSDELLEMCEYYLRRYSDPFDGLGSAPSDLKFLTESGKSALLKAVTVKSELLKSHVLELDAYLEKLQQGSNENL